MADKNFLDEDGVSQFAEETKKYIDKHIANADIHVTPADKANWNGKQDALTAEQLAAVNSGINATAKGNYDAHIANADIHVTPADKANWNGKQDALTSQQIDNINDVVNKANASDLTAHTNNADIHVTAADKTRWNGKQNALSTAQLNACNSGITSTKVATYDGYASAISSKANASDLTAHIANTDIHVTTSDKTRWNAKQDALTSQQLSNIADVVNKANDSDVVHKTGNESISGNKTFTSLTTKSTNLERGTVPSTQIIEDPIFISVDKNNRRTFAFYNYYYTSGDGRVVLYAYNQNTTDFDNIGLAFNFGNTNNSKSIFPIKQNTYYLGTTSNKWKDVNTVLLNGKTPAYADDLSAVATSGSYNDLSDKPTIPTVNNATLTIQKNGTTVETFTANASSNVTANIVVPTKTSELTNDSGFLTTHNPVDSALSSTSTNAVQNKVISTALNTKADVSDLSNYLPLSGGQMTGSIVMDANIAKSSDNSSIELKGGSAWAHGALLALNGKDNTGGAGEFYLYAHNGTNSCTLVGTPYGSLTWGGKNVDTIEEQGNGYIRYSSGLQICWGSMNNNNNVGTGITQVNFVKAFSKVPTVTVNTSHLSNTLDYVCQAHYIIATYFRAYCYLALQGSLTSDGFHFSWHAIGYWK